MSHHCKTNIIFIAPVKIVLTINLLPIYHKKKNISGNRGSISDLLNVNKWTGVEF